ncbi:MAG TPA: DNA mismatch repair endonuclease MutL [Clostridia bacterium]
MSKINILDSDIYNLIAAGEVVERPSSIVKELVENSIDAGADNITVEIKEGGLKYIKVSDNGCGIEKDDLKKALLPHATSKIAHKEDLLAISTLGFRGEALASIAAVSKVKILSRPAGSELGAQITCQGGEFSEIIELGSPLGTYITVEDLFYNVPARAKFLGKPATEENNITNYITRLILANPNIALKYIADGKTIFQFAGKGAESAIYTIYGQEALDNCIYVSQDYPLLKISGYICAPNYTKPNRTYQTVIINGRYVNNETVSLAVYNAYKDLLMKRQYPFYVLYLTVPYDKIDVNVHPNKLDVRFWDKGYVYRTVFSTIQRALNQNRFIKEIKDNDSEPIQDKVIQEIGSKEEIEKTTQNNNILDNKNSFNFYFDDISKSSNTLKDDGGRMTILLAKLADMKKEQDDKKEQLSFEQTDNIDYLPQKPAILGVLFNTYVLIEYDNNLYIIDQHAAHERLLFDRFIKSVNDNANEIQDLLAPYVFNVNHLEQNKLLQILDELQNLGFDIAEFGNLTFKISSVPFLLSDINLKEFVAEILSHEFYKNISASALLREKIASAACKAAIKAGDNIKESEILSLINQLNSSQTQLLCPHGRPIITKISKKEIEKWFKRIV